MLPYISNCLDRDKFEVYVDIKGSKTAAGWHMPLEAAVTNLKHDGNIGCIFHKKCHLCQKIQSGQFYFVNIEKFVCSN